MFPGRMGVGFLGRVALRPARGRRTRGESMQGSAHSRSAQCCCCCWTSLPCRSWWTGVRYDDDGGDDFGVGGGGGGDDDCGGVEKMGYCFRRRKGGRIRRFLAVLGFLGGWQYWSSPPTRKSFRTLLLLRSETLTRSLSCEVPTRRPLRRPGIRVSRQIRAKRPAFAIVKF